MADLKEYEYVLNGIAVTVMLTEDDAARLGAKEVKARPVALVAEAKARPEVRNAARPLPPNKAR